VNKLVLLVGIVFLVACGTGKTKVMQAGETKIAFDHVALQEGNSSISVPPEVKAAFIKQLSKSLYSNNFFQRDKGLTIKYRFIQFSGGSRLKRWLAAGIGGAGEGSLSVGAIFIDSEGKQLSEIVSIGKIGSGVFGDSIYYALEKAAEKAAVEIGNYTISQYK
jgi:hypothetical protein